MMAPATKKMLMAVIPRGRRSTAVAFIPTMMAARSVLAQAARAS